MKTFNTRYFHERVLSIAIEVYTYITVYLNGTGGMAI